jgi:hypothetical protein
VKKESLKERACIPGWRCGKGTVRVLGTPDTPEERKKKFI